MTETMLSQATAQTQTSGSEAVNTDAQNAQPQQQQATDSQTKGSGQPAEVGQPSNDQATEAPAGAPDRYEFKSPEGVEYDANVLSAYGNVAKELNMTQEAAQKMLDKLAPVLRDNQVSQIEATKAEWVNSSKADKEFGGESLDANLAVAKKALDTYGSPELLALLNESGLGNHPEIIRVLYRAGKAISEDRFVGGKATAGKASGPRGFNELASVLYPNQ